MSSNLFKQFFEVLLSQRPLTSWPPTVWDIVSNSNFATYKEKFL